MEQTHLALERYAEVLAHTVYFGAARKPEALARLGVDQALWATSEAKWTAAMVGEALQDERPATAAFAAAYGPVLKRLKTETPAIESIGAPAASEAGTTEPPPAEPVACPPPPPEPALPSLANQPEERWARWAGPQRMGDTEEVNVATFRAALPFVQGQPSIFAARGTIAWPAPQSGATLELPRDARVSGSPPLGVEQYAALCAELEVSPSAARDTFRRYGFASASEAAEVAASWQQRFAREPSEQQAWERLRRALVAQLRTKGQPETKR